MAIIQLLLHVLWRASGNTQKSSGNVRKAQPLEALESNVEATPALAAPEWGNPSDLSLNA